MKRPWLGWSFILISDRLGGCQATSLGINQISMTNSADGKHTVFSSLASNLGEGDNYQAWDILLFDDFTSQLKLVSHHWEGAVGHGDSYAGMILNDGRWLAFNPSARNLALGTPVICHQAEACFSCGDQFLINRETCQVKRISINVLHFRYGLGFDAYQPPSLSGRGRRLGFLEQI